MSTFLIGGYWSQRKETRSECAFRLARFMERVSNEDVLLSHWYKKGYSRKQAKSSRIGINVGLLENLLKEHRRDVDGVVTPDLGFNFSAWNGNFTESASIMVTCGAYSRYVGNAVVLKPPLVILREHPSTADALLKILVEVWDPERTIVEQQDGTRVEKIWRTL